MGKVLTLMGTLCLGASLLQATELINRDDASYKIKVESLGGEGNVVIWFHRVKAGGTLAGLCDSASCTFEMGDSRVTVKKDERVTIRNGRLFVEPPEENK